MPTEAGLGFFRGADLTHSPLPLASERRELRAATSEILGADPLSPPPCLCAQGIAISYE